MTKLIVAYLLLGVGVILTQAGNENLEQLVSKVLQEAEYQFDCQTLNATINGAQTRAYIGGYAGHYKIPGSVKTNNYTESIGKISNINQKALDILVNQHKMDRSEAVTLLVKQLPAACQQPAVNCNFNSRYRTIDGTCNNINNPRWGSVNRPFNRIAPAAYEDGVSVPRGGTSRLPNARVVSVNVHPDLISPNPAVTNMVPQFGQFLDHDITFTPEGGRQCCAGQNDPDCFVIRIAPNDPFYSRFGQQCMDFTRSTAFCFPTTNGIREQMNGNTAFIDGSQVYASAPTRANQLRTFAAGSLKSNTQLTGFLPATSQVDSTQINAVGQFIAGDDRINENPALTALHNVFLMEHNRIANQIRNLRPTWTDESIFQEARRIVGAELQQITYDQYLPIVLGPATMQRYNLLLGNEYTTYDPTRDPTIINSFATAAYRFGHSLINGLVRLIAGRNDVGSYQVRDNFGQSGQFTQSNGQGYDWILGGLMMQNSQNFDPFISVDVTNFLFKAPNAQFGADLAARNIQRGRDHGLPGYNYYRGLCGLTRITSMGVAPVEIRSDAWTRIQQLYTNPDDIDLFTGGLVEIPVANGLSGPTLNCIKGIQFDRLKSGDRYFFTHGNQAGSFTPVQIRQLRARTLGDIICENSQRTETTRNVFLIPSSSNPWIPCNDATRARLNFADFV